jgi:surfactin synthase thioesterase subunit
MELFAFPFAGGSEHCYRELSNSLKGINLRVQPLPGRGSLISQPCISRIEEMVEYLFRQVNNKLQPPYAFFGHSMGAFIAYMLCRKISNENMPMPKALILSGRKAPSVAEDELKHTMPDQKFRKMLRELGGIPDAVWEDQDIMALFEPIIRADFELIETYAYQRQNALDIPVHLFLGRDDNVTPDQAEAWQKETIQPINITYFDGGHFYFKDDSSLLAQKITEKLMG